MHLAIDILRLENWATHDFVRHDDEVVCHRELCDVLKLVTREDLAYRVVWRVEHDHLRAGRDRTPVLPRQLSLFVSGGIEER